MNEQAKPSLINALAKNYDMDPVQFYQVIKHTVMPQGATDEQTAAFLMVAKEYGLSPLLKEIHAFTARKGGGIVPVISVDGWSAMVNRHPQYDGVEFAYDQEPDGRIVSVTCTMWRKDRSHPTVVTEFMSECWRDTDAWRGSPGRMLRHRGFMQAARLTFGFSGAYDEESAPYNPGFVDVTPGVTEAVTDSKPANRRPPSPPPPKTAQKPVERDLPSGGTQTPARPQKPADEPAGRESSDVLVERLSAALDRCDTVEELQDVWQAHDVEASLTHDPDALELLDAVYARAEKKLKAKEEGRR